MLVARDRPGHARTADGLHLTDQRRPGHHMTCQDQVLDRRYQHLRVVVRAGAEAIDLLLCLFGMGYLAG
jgi:hypothetical protein